MLAIPDEQGSREIVKTKELLSLTNVSKTFHLEAGLFGNSKRTVQALKNINFSLAQGESAALVGESGSGKTTLGYIACRLLLPDAGDVLIEGLNIQDISRQALSTRIKMIFQDPFASLNPKLSIGTMLFEALNKRRGENSNIKESLFRDRKGIHDILELTGLPRNILNEYPHSFSGGQRQRIAIARALLKNPRVLIADEPLSSLDVSTQSQILNLFNELKKTLSLTFLFITHDIAAASVVADKIAVMKDGEILETGEALKVIASPKHEYTKLLFSSTSEM